MEQSASGLGRRSLVRGAAWSVPAIAIAAAAPAMAASPCAFTWQTRVFIQANCIIRDKHEATGKGDCSDVSVDSWLTQKDNGDGTVTVVPYFRVIVGTQLDISDVSATFALSRYYSPLDASTLTAAQVPAAGATPEIYKVRRDFTVGDPVLLEDGYTVRWNIGSMLAGSSTQFQVAGQPVTIESALASQKIQEGLLTVSGIKDCGAAPQACPGVESRAKSEPIQSTCITGGCQIGE